MPGWKAEQRQIQAVSSTSLTTVSCPSATRNWPVWKPHPGWLERRAGLKTTRRLPSDVPRSTDSRPLAEERGYRNQPRVAFHYRHDESVATTILPPSFITMLLCMYHHFENIPETRNAWRIKRRDWYDQTLPPPCWSVDDWTGNLEGGGGCDKMWLLQGSSMVTSSRLAFLLALLCASSFS